MFYVSAQEINETKICNDIYYFIINHLDNKGEIVYNKDEIINLTEKVELVDIQQTINYINNYNQLCENLTGLKIPKENSHIPIIYVNYTLNKYGKLICSPIINQTFLLVDLDTSINCFWGENCGINIGSIDCENLDFWRYLFYYEKNTDENYVLKGIKVWWVITLFIIGGITSGILIRKRLKNLEKK